MLGPLALARIKKVLTKHHSKDLSFALKIKTEMSSASDLYPWRCSHCQRLNKKTHVECPQCYSHWSTGERHNTEPRSARYYEEDWNQWQDDWNDGNSSRSSSRRRQGPDPAAQQVQTPRSQAKGAGQRAGKGKGKKSKGKGQHKDGGQDVASPFQMPQPKTLEAWQQLDTTGFMPSSVPSGSPFQVTSAEGGGLQEMAAALRRAYPDPTKTPEDVQGLLDKADKEVSRLGLKNLHQAAKHLDRTKKQLKDVTDQKRSHRSTWLKHLTEGIEMWEKQLDAYRRHQALLADLANKARSEITSTSRVIQVLSSAGTGSTTPLPPMPDATETIEAADEQVDQEEEALRSKLQTVLKACADSLGVLAETPAKEIEIKSDTEHEEGTEGVKPSKRPRSLEPFGGGARSSPP